MTINDVISAVNTMRPGNKVEQELIVKWLSDLDGQIINELVNNREGYEDVVYTPYTRDTDGNTELVIKAPYANAYVFYVTAQIDMLSDEISKYNNSIAMFEAEYTSFRNNYNASHRTLRRRARWF
jgi:hypothetical protein